MSRYIERAESLARLVDAHYRMSLLPHDDDELAQSLAATMTALHMADGLHREARHYRTARRFRVRESRPRIQRQHFELSARGPRERPRGARLAHLGIVETLNSTWLDARSLVARSGPHVDIGQFVEWVKDRSHLTRGVTIGTMLRDEAFHFTRIGTFLERADSTARILTAHQTDLKPGADAGAVPDPFEWSVLLRALSAFEVYRRVYRDVITPVKVAQLLILRDDMPRSLLRCCKEVYQNLKSVINEHSAETERRAGEMHAMLHFTRMEDILAHGLPEFLSQFLARVNDLGDRIASDFLVPPAEA